MLLFFKHALSSPFTQSKSHALDNVFYIPKTPPELHDFCLTWYTKHWSVPKNDLSLTIIFYQFLKCIWVDFPLLCERHHAPQKVIWQYHQVCNQPLWQSHWLCPLILLGYFGFPNHLWSLTRRQHVSHHLPNGCHSSNKDDRKKIDCPGLFFNIPIPKS